MTYSDSLRKLISNQSKQEKKLNRLKVAEKSARTDDIIRRQMGDDGLEYVEIGLNLVDHTQLVPNNSFDGGETGWKIELIGDPGAGSWSYWMGLGELNVGGQPIEGCSISIECIEPVYLYSIGKVHEYHLFYYNMDYGISDYIGWTLSITEYGVDDEIIRVNSVSWGPAPLPGVPLDLYGPFIPTADTAYIKISMVGTVPVGIKTPTSMQSTIAGVSVKSRGVGQESIETNGTLTTIKSTSTVVEGALTAGNVSATPTANYIPKADGAGKLAAGWIPDLSGTYLGVSAKAADSDKLDNIDSTGFVQTSGDQTVGGIKTFSSIPVLPETDPTTANQAVRKGFADATYLGIDAGTWQSYTPSLSWTGGTTDPTSATFDYAKYTQIGKMVTVQIILTVVRGSGDRLYATIGLPFVSAVNGIAGTGVEDLTSALRQPFNVSGYAYNSVTAYPPSAMSRDGSMRITFTYPIA